MKTIMIPAMLRGSPLMNSEINPDGTRPAPQLLELIERKRRRCRQWIPLSSGYLGLYDLIAETELLEGVAEALTAAEATRLQVEQALKDCAKEIELQIGRKEFAEERAETAEASRAAMIVPLAAKIEIAAVHHCCMPSNLQDAPPFSEWCRLIKT